MSRTDPVFTDRATARERLSSKVASQRRVLADPHAFATVDPNLLIEDALFRLRWIDCAPEGANHIIAPLQGKSGIPCDTWNDSENIGPNKAVRAAKERRGLLPAYAPITAS